MIYFIVFNLIIGLISLILGAFGMSLTNILLIGILELLVAILTEYATIENLLESIKDKR